MSTGIQSAVESRCRFFYDLPRRFKGACSPYAQYEEELRGTADPIQKGKREGVNGPCSRIPPLIKAPALIIVLDRQSLCLTPLLPRGAYLKSLKFFFLTSYMRATINEVKMFVLSKCDIVKATTVSHRSLKRNVRLIRSRQVLRLHSLAKSEGRVFYKFIHTPWYLKAP